MTIGEELQNIAEEVHVLLESILFSVLIAEKESYV